jgi:UDP-glucose:(heptosyl)LPS alpha-1,3-glucosyltransferase
MAHYKLAFAVSKYFEFGGMQRTMLRIAMECCTRGHQVDVFTGTWEGAKPDVINVIEVDISSLTNPGKNDKLAETLRRKVKGANYNGIVGFTKIPGLDIYYAGDPCFAAKFEETKPQSYRCLPRYRDFLRQEREVFQKGLNTEILLIAHSEKDKFIKYYGTEETRFHLLPPGINKNLLLSNIPTRTEQHYIRQALGVGDQQFLILCVGSGFRTKGVDRAIKALSALSPEIRYNSTLVVVGEGNEKSFQRLARRHKVSEQVKFTGVHRNVSELYHSADMLIQPSYSENTGTALLEAMLCGLPVLTTENCGFSYHVARAGAGMICPTPFKQEALDKQLEFMLRSDDQSIWKENGVKYCNSTDLYSLIEKAANVILARAEANRREVSSKQ